MKIPLLAAVVAGATLTQVAASPLRVVVVTSNHQELPAIQKFRFGHALADSPVAKVTFPNSPVNPVRRPCGNRIKDKALKISNAFRHALGLPTIETAHPQPGDHVHDGMVHILPFVGTPNTFIEAPTHDMKTDNLMKTAVLPHPHRHYHNEAQRIRRMGNTFWMRVHNAIMALGPWEGRAVAFVFGCGIGVLFRMFWVLTVVIYRSIRGERDDEYTSVAVFEVDDEDIIVPPPTYSLADEKDQTKAKDVIET